jgi:hypothetical protein
VGDVVQKSVPNLLLCDFKLQVNIMLHKPLPLQGSSFEDLLWLTLKSQASKKEKGLVPKRST